MDFSRYHRIRPGESQNEVIKRAYKMFAIIVLACTICASIPIEYKCYAQEKSEKATSIHKLSFVGNWDEERAIKIVTDICAGWLFPDAQGGYGINTSLSFQRNNIKKQFFQILANSESCRFCPGLIGAVIFSEINGTWKVEFEEEHFARFGCYGDPPEGKLIKIGSGRHGLLFQWWRSGQGGGYVHYVALIDLGDKGYPLILGEQIYQTDNSRDPLIPKLEVTSTINGEFYDIKIDSKTYKFLKSKYKALSK